MKVFEGLFGYEIVMLVLGSILFLLLAFLLAWLIMKKRSYKQTLIFFIISIVMISFPGIQKITYEKGKLELEKITMEINSENKNEVKSLERKINAIESRISSYPEGLVALAKANLALGDTNKAVAAVTRALNIDSGSLQAQEMKKTIYTNYK